jgi:hypothetical protein
MTYLPQQPSEALPPSTHEIAMSHPLYGTSRDLSFEQKNAYDEKYFAFVQIAKAHRANAFAAGEALRQLLCLVNKAYPEEVAGQRRASHEVLYLIAGPSKGNSSNRTATGVLGYRHESRSWFKVWINLKNWLRYRKIPAAPEDVQRIAAGYGNLADAIFPLREWERNADELNLVQYPPLKVSKQNVPKESSSVSSSSLGEEGKKVRQAIVLQAFDSAPSQKEFERLCTIAESERTDEANHQILTFLVKLLVEGLQGREQLLRLPGTWMLGRACKIRWGFRIGASPEEMKTYYETRLSEPILTLEEVCALPLRPSTNL